MSWGRKEYVYTVNGDSKLNVSFRYKREEDLCSLLDLSAITNFTENTQEEGNVDVNIIIHKKAESFFINYFNDEEVFNINKSLNQNIIKYFPTIHIYRAETDNDATIEMCRHYQYLDSSIWNRRIVQGLDDEILVKLLEFLIKIKQRYYLKSAQEYIFLQEQLFQVDYASRKYGENDNEGHLNDVAPFLFHSESVCRDRILQFKNGEGLGKVVQEQKNEALKLKHKWRFLLVDDCAAEDCGRPLSSTENTIKLYRKDIIKEDLELILDLKDEHDNNAITIDCASSVEEASKILSSEKYDIILLDYKIDRKDENKDDNYGYKLLTEIRDDKDEKLQGKAAPNKQFYFMFISAYTTAVQERLMCENLSTKEKYWFIGRGACPTNTPYLFLYSLLRLMRLRVEDLTKAGEMLRNALEIYNEDEPVTVIDFLTILFKIDKETRMRCVKSFNALLTLRSTYDNIKNDCKQTEKDETYSRLINSMFPDASCYSNSFWEHLQNLIYLTAFGTIRQWPEMWEDYMFVKNKLMLAEDACKIKENKPSDLIRNYILKLKEQL